MTETSVSLNPLALIIGDMDGSKNLLNMNIDVSRILSDKPTLNVSTEEMREKLIIIVQDQPGRQS